MTKERLDFLLSRHRENTATPAELGELRSFFTEDKYRELFIDLVAEQLIKESDTDFDSAPYLPIAEKVLEIDKSLTFSTAPKPNLLTSFMRSWKAIAASVLFVGLGAWLYSTLENKQMLSEAPVVAEVFAPDAIRAAIILANGESISLDSLRAGTFQLIGGVNLIKTSDGQLIYERDETASETEIVYNTITNPRGSKVVDLQLSDGTKVWLNAGSSLTYPTLFREGARKVELRGEGYFEVATASQLSAKGARTISFEVLANGISTQVHGTHFNIKAFAEAKSVAVALLEGSVKVGYQGKNMTSIQPGQAACLSTTSESKVNISSIQASEVLAWKEGWISFENRDLDDILQEIARWYDVEVSYPTKSNPDIKLFGKVGKDLRLSQVVEVLQLIGIDCKLEKNKLIVN